MIRAVPEGFRWVEGGAGRVWILRDGRAPGPGDAPWDEWLAGTGGGEVIRGEGRQPPRVVTLPGQGEVVIRRYLRGGQRARILGDRLWGARRPMGELSVSEALRRRGVRTPEVLALYWRRTRFGSVRACLLTRRIPYGRSLRRWLGQEGRARGRWREVLGPVAEAVGALHDAGCIHRDLNLGNLVRAEGQIHILDLDGGRLRENLTVGDRGRNLLRLYRSLAKETGQVDPLSGRERLRFLACYTAGDGRLRRELRNWMDGRWEPARWRRILRHRLRAD